jgi:hypothetical protein
MSVMNARLFTASASRAFDGKDITSRYGTRLLRCGIQSSMDSRKALIQLGLIKAA